MRSFLTSCFIACFVASMASSMRADTISFTNGDFESISSGSFTGWTYGATPGTNVATDYTTHPISGVHTAQLKNKSNAGSTISQTISNSGLADLKFDVDFAVLTAATSGSRTFSMTWTNGSTTNANVEVFRVESVTVGGTLKYSLQYATQISSIAVWRDTGLYANATQDTGTLKTFDGETPLVNHLQIIATGQGTANPSLKFTLTGGQTDGSFTYAGSVGNCPGSVKNVILAGSVADSNFLVDNVAISSVPEPSTVALLIAAFFGLMAYAWRKRQK